MLLRRHSRKRRGLRFHRHRSPPAQDSRLRQAAARLRPGTSRTGSARRKEAYTSLKVKGHGSRRFRRSLYIRPCPQTTTGSCRKKYNLIRKNSRPSRTAAPDERDTPLRTSSCAIWFSSLPEAAADCTYSIIWSSVIWASAVPHIRNRAAATAVMIFFISQILQTQTANITLLALLCNRTQPVRCQESCLLGIRTAPCEAPTTRRSHGRLPARCQRNRLCGIRTAPCEARTTRRSHGRLPARCQGNRLCGIRTVRAKHPPRGHCL